MSQDELNIPTKLKHLLPTGGFRRGELVVTGGMSNLTNSKFKQIITPNFIDECSYLFVNESLIKQIKETNMIKSIPIENSIQDREALQKHNKLIDLYNKVIDIHSESISIRKNIMENIVRIRKTSHGEQMKLALGKIARERRLHDNRIIFAAKALVAIDDNDLDKATKYYQAAINPNRT